MSLSKNMKSILGMIGVFLAIVIVMSTGFTQKALAYDEKTAAIETAVTEKPDTLVSPQPTTIPSAEPSTAPTEQPVSAEQTITVKRTAVMDIPSKDGTVTEVVDAGTTVDVYETYVNNEWNAIRKPDGTMRYILASATANTAASYTYEYMSDLTTITNYSGAQLEEVLRGTGLAGLGEYFAQKEKTHGINALFLIGITKLESASGTSSLARSKNNLGGLKNGSSGYLSFDSKQDCVEYMANILKDNYLSENGKHYKGTTSQAVSIRYCEQSTSWYQQVENLMKSAYNEINS
ncbi:MAG: glucosaminidase domain-containing protein [Christensenellaceae bacterium]